MPSGGKIIHGKAGSPIYAIYRTMLARCYNSKNHKFKHYGQRGILVCDRWHKFENFYEDMGDKPNGKSLDRIDNNGPYSKENCRWASYKEQQNNRRDNILISFEGQTKTLSQWATDLGFNYKTLSDRIFISKWPLGKAFKPGRVNHCKNGHKFSLENTYKAKKQRVCRACSRVWKANYVEKRKYAYKNICTP